ncbi:clamp-binding protein CrfC [Escherichia fergusonii]|uniref:clamp-binding protein CrfC n=1 Tax=Escherichia fergusonii TaxID=564 RepID=UPI0020CF1C34|nr:clamp-binding protein CrfC [Escherichia fergusonii]MCP9672488.1 clamp-binding protein CrfC [Escherichia fergusonii]
MYTQTIYELSQEAERLLLLAIEQLDSAQHSSASQQDTGVPTVTEVKAQREMLQNELCKVTRLEMVLAIVGTMKAGKSTTINAIVGTEVLPNRNRPMTALPTLIRHTPGQKDPILHFSHVAPIDQLMAELQQRMHTCDYAYLTEVLEIDKDMQALLQRIETGLGFEKHYLGAQPIFQCLKSLNDLVRLSKALRVDFPFTDYATLEHIPVIEVEFVHLAGREDYPGQLTLLDTPGPNEAGQPHLQKMLREQLARASAVLAIMDYTQLKSVSDEDLRQTIAAVGKLVPLYALVNKFDQQDRNSDDEDQVKALISGTLMKGSISPGQIFPVSSMWGYLANRARYELQQYGRLPDPDEQRWVRDFADAALGRRWRNTDLTDSTAIRQAADQLWEDSLLERPIQALLHAAYANASLFALRSASHKILNYAQTRRDSLNFRERALSVATEQLQQHIAQLEDDLQLLKVNQMQVNDEINHEIVLALAAADHYLQQRQSDILRQFVALFNRKNVHDKAMREGWLPQADITDETLVLPDEGQAQIVLSKIRASCEGVLLAAQDEISRDMTLRFTQLESTLNRTLTEAVRPIEQRVVSALNHSGFHAHIRLAPLHRTIFNFNIRPFFVEAIAEEAPPDRQGRMRETFSRWFNQPDWSGNEYLKEKRRYTLEITRLHQHLTDYVQLFCQQISKALAAHIDVSVTAAMAAFFSDFTRELAEIQQNLRESLVVRQHNESALNVLREQLKQTISSTGWMLEDARLLRDDIQTLLLTGHNDD